MVSDDKSLSWEGIIKNIDLDHIIINTALELNGKGIEFIQSLPIEEKKRLHLLKELGYKKLSVLGEIEEGKRILVSVKESGADVDYSRIMETVYYELAPYYVIERFLDKNPFSTTLDRFLGDITEQERNSKPKQFRINWIKSMAFKLDYALDLMQFVQENRGHVTHLGGLWCYPGILGKDLKYVSTEFEAEKNPIKLTDLIKQGIFLDFEEGRIEQYQSSDYVVNLLSKLSNFGAVIDRKELGDKMLQAGLWMLQVRHSRDYEALRLINTAKSFGAQVDQPITDFANHYLAFAHQRQLRPSYSK